ncbi:MAG TPA: YARHG domain-containing protein, partial [Candidatus Deferrimicrobium sp.]|nr:YARHG domain-containing protein [Candidatus Deferrimicrobium sp.]
MTLKKKLLSIGMIIALITLLGCNGIKETTTSSQENLQGVVLDSSQNQAKDNSFIFPQSSTRKLTFEELNGLDSEELPLARNEIYARRGYVFAETKYTNYFKQKTWYKPDTNPRTDLNSIELYNVSFIKFFERRFANIGSRKQLSNVYKLGQNVQLDINGDDINEKLFVQKMNDNVIIGVNS